MAHVRSLFSGPLADVENKAIMAFNSDDQRRHLEHHQPLQPAVRPLLHAADGHVRPDELTDEETMALVDQMGEAGLPALFSRWRADDAQELLGDPREGARLRHPRDVSTNCTFMTRDAPSASRPTASTGSPPRCTVPRVPRRDGWCPRHPRPSGRGDQDLREEGVNVGSRRPSAPLPGLRLRPHRRGQGPRRRPALLLRPHHRRPQRGEDDGRITPSSGASWATSSSTTSSPKSPDGVGHRRDAQFIPLSPRSSWSAASTSPTGSSASRSSRRALWARAT